MSATAVVGACLVSCFVSVTNPWFYTTKCGQNGCPLFHKAANRGRAEVEERGEEIRQAGRRTRFWGCGEDWNEEAERRNEQTIEGGDGKEERRNRNEPYRGTSPMRIDEPVSLGVDVSHLAPPPQPINSDVIDRANEGDSGDFGGGDRQREREERGTEQEGKEKAQEDKEKGRHDNDQDQSQWPDFVQVPGGVPKAPPSVLSSGQVTLLSTSRPLLDEAISWDRLAGVGKERKKRKWWHMP
ncbi:hypothetical protein OPQ81_003452 [Rhizoctonia solani]|nr:hypothetical protein OPQ81_003452 [Rhizoctonia solani]